MDQNFRPRLFKREARAALKGKWNESAVICLLIMMFSAIIGGLTFWQVPIQIFGQTVMVMHPTANGIYIFLSFFVTPIFTIGAFFVFLDVLRGHEPEVDTLFEPTKSYWRYIGANLWINILVLLWMLLMFIPGIIKACAYSQTFFIMRENPDMKIRDAIRLSRRMMKGHKWHFFILCISFIGWIIVGTLALVIGLIWVMPYIYTSLASFYEGVKRDYAERMALEDAE